MEETALVITGLGVISPAGIGRDNFWKGISAGENCFREITLFDTGDFKVTKAGEITEFNPLDFIEKRHLRTLDRSTRLLIAATQLALGDAGLEITDQNTNDIGVVVGATFGSLHSICSFDIEGLVEGPKYVNPSFFPNTVINSPAGQVSIRFKLKGFNTTISTGFCASADAISYAMDFLRLDRASLCLVSGVEELCEETFRGFNLLGLLSGSDGTEPFSAPYDRGRNGLVLSEGASVLVIEKEESASRRQAEVLAKVLASVSAFTSETDKLFSSGSGLKRAILKTIEMAGLTPDDIDLIFSSANSTRELDYMEANVINDIFGNDVLVTAIKSTIGETYSASGAFLVAAAVETLQRGYIPITKGVYGIDPECKINLVKEKTLADNINNILVICSDPFGNNTAILLQRY